MSRGRVLLVEDEEILRSSLALFLKKSGFEVKEAEDEPGAVRLLTSECFNLVITDIFLCDGSGFGIMKHLYNCCPETKCIAITGHASLDSAIRALRKGAFDYLLKPFEYAALKSAVERAMERQAEEMLVHKLDFQKVARQYGLTRKELEIVKVIISEGLSNDDVAERLKISRNTVKVHLRNIFKKTKAESKTALTTMLLSGGPK